MNKRQNKKLIKKLIQGKADKDKCPCPNVYREECHEHISMGGSSFTFYYLVCKICDKVHE